MSGGWRDHLIITPILLPLVASALLLLVNEQRRAFKNGISVAAVAATLLIQLSAEPIVRTRAPRSRP